MIDEGATCQHSEAKVIHLTSEMVDEQDRLLPIANVGRVMRQILPPSAKISKEAKETIQECATEFISFVTAEASDKCYKENRKTVNGDDICWALSTLGFDTYAEAMLRYLHKYREFERQRVNQSKASNLENEAHTPIRVSTDSTDSDGSNLQPEKQSESPIAFEFRVLEKGQSSKIKPAAKG
ncbi:nuclear transcription factor Y subunit B-4-like [Coffea arabica]|uniref:Nuclear transcription factor Y subunit B-4-like n=2 Tax=Coffea TaxID=13442 RepID=A0A6P6W2F5_COFAR